VVDRRDLEGALLRATDWVQAEYAYIEDVAVGMGCEKRLESGPGVALRLDGKVIFRAHPKRDHLAVGLPDRMRSDVQALTLVLRAQKFFAWFNYEPGVADRDTIELLLSSSADLARSTTRRPQSNLRDNNRVPPNDEADLRLILTVLRAFQNCETATGDTSAAKPLRETLFFRWEAPRLPPGGKYSPLIPHSPAARDQYATHASKGLVYEHVVPISGVIRELLRNMPTDEQALRQVLEATADRVIITKAEDSRVTAAGYRDTAPDPADPWSRYHVLGLQRSDFAPRTGP